MATAEKQAARPAARPKSAGDRLPSKELRAVARRFKQGYTLQRTGGGHYRVRDRNGRFVEVDGKPLSLVGNPSPGVIRAWEDQLTEAQVIRGTETRITEELKRRRVLANRRQAKERRKRRDAEAKALREKLGEALSFLGNLRKPGIAADLGYVGFLLVREQAIERNGDLPPTPDLFTGNANRVVNGSWVEPRYAVVWEAIAERVAGAKSPVEEWYSLVRRARGIREEEVVQFTPPKNVEGDWPFRVELLSFDHLFIAPYQRPVNWPFVRKEAARFDPTLVGTIDVAARPREGRFSILDGQQRVEICRLVGKDTIWASVYTGLDEASEARFFLHKNHDRNAMHPLYTFRARVIAADPDALAIQAIVQSFGYELAISAARPGRNEHHIAAVAAVLSAYAKRRPDGTECLTPTLATLRLTTLGREQGQASVLIRGLASLYSTYSEDELQEPILREAINALGPALILGRARDLARGSGGNAEQATRKVLVSEYDRRAGRELKLPRKKAGT